MEGRFDAGRLESLLESAKLLNSSLELEDLLRHLLRTVMGRMLITRGLVAIGGEIQVWRGIAGIEKGHTFDAARGVELKLPLIFPIGDDLGMLALGQPLKGSLDEDERGFLEALLGLAASSVSNAQAHEETLRSNRSLDQKIQELRALLDLVRGLAATTDAEEVAQLLMLTLAGRWAVSKHAVLTWKAESEPVARVKGLVLPPVEKIRAVVEGMREPASGEAIGLAAGSMLFPLRSGDTSTGVVILGPRLSARGYTEADLDFGTGLVAQASVALDNAWHFQDTLAKRAIERELEVAAAIQQDLFPKRLPELANTDIAARNRQAKQVGGDYYDVLECGCSHLLCVADISGKGITAALLMSIIQATLRALLAHETSIGLIAAKTNDLLWASTPASKYATAFFLRYDAATGEGEYVNGGHNDGVILRQDGSVEMLGTTGLPVGLFPKREYDVAPVRLAPGDLMLIYSDGVSEANNSALEEFGMDRLVGCLRESAHRPATEILDHLFVAIDAFADGAPQSDDITVMVVKRLEN